MPRPRILAHRTPLQYGYTLIEILIVIAICEILLGQSVFQSMYRMEQVAADSEMKLRVHLELMDEWERLSALPAAEFQLLAEQSAGTASVKLSGPVPGTIQTEFRHLAFEELTLVTLTASYPNRWGRPQTLTLQGARR